MIVNLGDFLPQYLVLRPARKQHAVGIWVKNFLRGMNSRGIPKCKMRTGKQRDIKIPIKTPKSGFIQAPAFIKSEIRRAGEQTSPQVARAAGHIPETGRGRRIDQWQQINSPFPFKALKITFKAKRGPRGQWAAYSEARASTR